MKYYILKTFIQGIQCIGKKYKNTLRKCFLKILLPTQRTLIWEQIILWSALESGTKL